MTGCSKPQGPDSTTAGSHASQVLVCEADEVMLPARCTHVPLDRAALRLQDPDALRKFELSPRYLGLEDARLLSWRGRAHLLGTVNMERVGGR